MIPEDFFVVLGYLASPDRECKLDVELPSTKEKSFKDRYAELSGVTPSVDHHNFYLWPEGSNKWGVELRIYFKADNMDNIPTAIRSMVVSARFPNPAHNCRINRNKFIWELIKHGFLLGDTQNLERIQERVPQEYMPHFERGLSLT